MRHYELIIASQIFFMLPPVAGCGPEPDNSVEPRGSLNRPPPPPPRKPGDGRGLVLAIDKIFLGDTNPDTSINWATGWKNYGLDIDGELSTAGSSNLCRLVGNGLPNRVYFDGPGGIDNSFGKILIPLIRIFNYSPSAKITDEISAGAFTMVLVIEGLGDDDSYYPLAATMYSGARLPSSPGWNGQDVWPVLARPMEESADNTAPNGVFRESYLVDNTWVSGTDGALDLKLRISKGYLDLKLRHVVITAQLDKDHHSAISGTISGVIKTDTFIDDARKFAASLNEGFCSGNIVDAMLSQIRSASDILEDGTQDPSRDCDAISIGVGFTAKEVRLGDTVPAPEPPADPCL
ncbi:hypothetical protein [Sorangium sp. So ce117]|uniref:hypothetical protein n=1 Tax=Sorangium sp. So ce117 TaxID=3133277 RepID=UPI003F60E8F4